MANEGSTVESLHPAYSAMLPTWELVDDLMGGTAAMKAAGEKWLPREDGEAVKVYEARLSRSVLYNGYKKTVLGLSRRPFARSVGIVGNLPEKLAEMPNAVDDQGRSLNSFAREFLKVAVNRGLCHILVDYPPNTAGSLGEERELGLRPRFVLVDPISLINWQTEEVNGETRLTQIRISESVYRASGQWDVKVTRRIRVIGLDAFQVYEQGEKGEWYVVQEGEMTLGKIALVTLYINPVGFMVGSPAMDDLAYMNLAHYQSQSDHRNNLRFARSGVIFLKGLTAKEMEQGIVWGVNHAVRTTNADADMKIIEHSGSAVTAGENELRHLEEQMDAVGMGPLTIRSWGNETAMGMAIDEGKGQCDLQSWVRDEEAVLEKAFGLAAEWTGETLAEDFKVDIYDDFGLLPRSAQDLDNLQKLRDRGDLSRRTILEGVKLRGLLPENHDIDEELARIEEEGPDLGMIGREEPEPEPEEEKE